MGTTEGSREKRAALCVSGSSSCKYCEGTLTFIPNIQGRRKIFEKRCSLETRTRKLRRNKQTAEFALITGQCCFKVTDSQGNCDIIEPGGNKKPRVLAINKIVANDCNNLACS